MKLFTKKDKRTKLEKEIDMVLSEMSSVNSGTEQYTTMTDNLVKLNEIEISKKSRRIKPEVIVNGLFYLAGIGLVLWYEEGRIITTKAFNLVKGRV